MSEEIKVREKLNLTKEEGRLVIWGDLEGFIVIEDKIVDNGRWNVYHTIVIQRKSDDKFFRDSYSKGATEYQSEMPYDYDDPDFTEVFPVEKKVIVYE